MKNALASMIAASILVASFPALADPPPVEAPRPLGAVLVTGIVTSAVGLSAASVGGVLFATTPHEDGCPVLEAGQSCSDFESSAVKTQRAAGIGLLVGGGALLAASIPLLIVGARTRGRAERSPEVFVGAGNARLRFQF